MLYGRLVHVGETFNGFQAVNYTKMRLAAGLCPDPLGGGSYSVLPDPLAVIRGRTGKEGKEWVGNREGDKGEERKVREGVGRDGKGKGRWKGEGGSGRERAGNGEEGSTWIFVPGLPSS